MTELNKRRFNHSPFISNVTVPFNGWRFKTEYVITDKTGLVVRGIPNGGAWCCANGIWIEDEDVVKVQTIADVDTTRFSFTGGWRVARDIDFFGKSYPIYCAGEFIYPDELPEDKKIIPIIVYGYRNKRSPEKMWLLTAVGEVVDVNDPRSGIDTLGQYAQDPEHFWSVEDSEVMSPYEVMSTIKKYNQYLLLREDKEWFDKASALLEEISIEKYQWVESMVLLPKLGDFDDVSKKLKETTGPDFKGRLGHIAKHNLNNDKRKSLLNEGRGPIVVENIPLYTVPVHSLIRG